MRYMVIENYTQGPEAVYRRFAAKGRLAPAGLAYLDSWVDVGGTRCFQLMECDDPALLEQWIAAWADLVDFEVVPVIGSADAAGRFAPKST